MADEPLQTLVSQIRNPRRMRRATWQPGQVTGDLVPGQAGQMSALDARAMNDAYVPDIGDAAPPTRPMAEEMDPGEYGEPPVAASEASPFQFASTGNCPDGQCGKNLPMGQQYQLSPQLPPGVTVGPGETYVQGSLKEVPTTASAPTTTTQPATTQAAAPAAPAGTGNPQFDQAYQIASQAYAPALQAYRGMQSVPSAMDKTAMKMQGDLHVRVGDAALAQMAAEKLNKQAAMLETQAREAIGLKDPVVLHKKEQEIIADLRAGEGTADQRAYAVVTRQLQALAESKVAVSEQDFNRMFELEKGVITARDVTENLSSGMALARDMQKNPSPEKAVIAWRLAGENRQRLFDRYGAEMDPNKLRMRVNSELGKVYYRAVREDLEAKGLEGDELEYRASDDTQKALAMAVSGINAMQRGEPAELPLPPALNRARPADAPAPQQAPARSSSWMDSLIIDPKNW